MDKNIDHSDMDSYLVSLSKRIAHLEVDTESMVDVVKERKTELKKQFNDYKTELAKAKDEMREIKAQISELSVNMTEVLKQFNQTTKKNELDRLNRKIEDFSPEGLATYKDMKKSLDSI